MNAYDGLSTEDKEALRRSAADLSDICPVCRARIEAGMREAYKRAEDIRLGLRNPMS